MTKYEAVRAKIVEACWSVGEEDTIRLSHVLRAIAKQSVPIHWVAVDCFGDFLDMEHEGNKDMALCNGINWNLTQDNLSLQSPDTIDFLFKILCE